ncbi:hypothetical protein [Ferrimonas marina]|uniref:Uncharacterized protein n=1 Tax=Ferrimonas marina TaxID=299255 RepID=A0A1M5Z638_9GAMM|nr:hypothetical protein [Ferrimonas marina]SHI19614.1 hypothetical protein SAMN02745129_4713 [Ferrimonas marina]
MTVNTDDSQSQSERAEASSRSQDDWWQPYHPLCQLLDDMGLQYRRKDRFLIIEHGGWFGRLSVSYNIVNKCIDFHTGWTHSVIGAHLSFLLAAAFLYIGGGLYLSGAAVMIAGTLTSLLGSLRSENLANILHLGLAQRLNSARTKATEE